MITALRNSLCSEQVYRTTLTTIFSLSTLSKRQCDDSTCHPITDNHTRSKYEHSNEGSLLRRFGGEQRAVFWNVNSTSAGVGVTASTSILLVCNVGGIVQGQFFASSNSRRIATYLLVTGLLMIV